MLANSPIIYAKRKKIIQNGVLYGEAHSLGSITFRGLDLICAVQSSFGTNWRINCAICYSLIYFFKHSNYIEVSGLKNQETRLSLKDKIDKNLKDTNATI